MPPEPLMQLMNTLRLPADEDDEDAFSKSSVCERVIFFLWLPKPKEWRERGRPTPADSDVDAACWLLPLESVGCVSGGVRFRLIGCTRGSLLRLLAKPRDGARKMLRRLPVLPELELVLDGEELWTPLPTPPEDGEDGRESCLLLLLRRKMGRRDTSVERREPGSPIETAKWEEPLLLLSSSLRCRCASAEAADAGTAAQGTHSPRRVLRLAFPETPPYMRTEVGMRD